MPKLKVFRMPVGFHDAYVAAPSQKAAAEAWGSDVAVFARGEAELVTDPALMEEPLARPGEIVKRLRGTAAEQVAALGEDEDKRPGRPGRVDPASEAAGRPGDADSSGSSRGAPRRARSAGTAPPRPSRAALDEAEAALAAAEAAEAQARKELAEREAALARERKALEKKHAEERERLEARREKAKAAYEEAMRRWRG